MLCSDVSSVLITILRKIFKVISGDAQTVIQLVEHHHPDLLVILKPTDSKLAVKGTGAHVHCFVVACNT